MHDILSGFLYVVCLVWPIIFIVVLTGVLYLISGKFPWLERLILGDYFTDDDDDEIFGDNNFYD